MKNRMSFLGVASAALALTCLPIKADAILASNFGNTTVTRYDAATGAFLGVVVSPGAELTELNGIRQGPDGSIFALGQASDNVVHYSPDGTLLNIMDPGNSAGLDYPQDLAFGPDGNLYVVSGGTDKILKYNPGTGASLGVFADLGGVGGHQGPVGLAFGPDGNLYVTTFDTGMIFKFNGQTGALLGTTAGPAGLALVDALFGQDGMLYFGGIDLGTLTGGIYRQNIADGTIGPFILSGTGGLTLPGGFVFLPGGKFALANLAVDQTFSDVGSSILLFDAQNGNSLGTLVSAGNGLNVPFFMIAEVPEPGTVGLIAAGLSAFGAARLFSRRRRLRRPSECAHLSSSASPMRSPSDPRM